MSEPCCPDEDRLPNCSTKSGASVFDLHEHRGMLKGFVFEDQARKPRFWYPTGRMTPVARTPHDIVVRR